MKKENFSIFSAVIGFFIGITVGRTFTKTNKLVMQQKTNKFRSYYNILLEWLSIVQQGKKLETYFIKHNYNTVAIYGMGELGIRLLNELETSKINVAYAIDQNEACGCSEIEIKEPTEQMEAVDAVIVTPVFAFDAIKNTLANYIDCQIISLEEVIVHSK